jgi:serine/threonine protein kinase
MSFLQSLINKFQDDTKTIKISHANDTTGYGKKTLRDFLLVDNIFNGNDTIVWTALYLSGRNKVILKIKHIDEFNKSFMENEAFIHSEAKHPNIVQLYESFYHDENTLVLVMEYFEAQHIRKWMQKKHGEDDGMELFKKVIPKLVEIIRFLHATGIAHRDIKHENILMNTKGKIMLIDFGASTCSNSNSSTVCGTQGYMAPEVCICQGYDPFKADIWSIGIVAFEILTRSYWRKNCTGFFQNSIETNMKDFVIGCLNNSPQLRPSIDQLYEFMLANFDGDF